MVGDETQSVIPLRPSFGQVARLQAIDAVITRFSQRYAGPEGLPSTKGERCAILFRF